MVILPAQVGQQEQRALQTSKVVCVTFVRFFRDTCFGIYTPYSWWLHWMRRIRLNMYLRVALTGSFLRRTSVGSPSASLRTRGTVDRNVATVG